MTWVVMGLLGALLTVVDDQPIDVRTVPAAERVAYFNRRADHLQGENAAEFYGELLAEFQPVSSLWILPEKFKERKAYDNVENNLDALALKPAWAPEEERVIREWLDANADLLRMLMSAVRRPRYYVSIPEDGGRLSQTRLDSLRMLFPSLGRFAMIIANDYAIRDNFTAAYVWNLRAHRMADHAYQRPGFFNWADGSRLECQAVRQTLSFMARRPSHDVADLLNQIRAGDERRLPVEVATELNMLEALDFIESFHQWAREPDKHPNVEEVVQTAFDSTLAEIMPDFLASPFPSREAFRAAVNKVTFDAEWASYLRTVQCELAWNARPFHQAWRGRDEFEKETCSALREAPAQSLYGCGFPAAWMGRYQAEEARMHRRALETVVALHAHQETYGRFPAALQELRAANPPLDFTDPYSGGPFVYRLRDDGAAFTLYSIGPDQTDDGGGPHCTSHNEAGDRVFWPPPDPKTWRLDDEVPALSTRQEVTP